MTAIRFIYLVLLIALATAINVHLPALQVVAWTGMIINYSEGRDLAEAVEMTFDGEHPCPMCKAIEAERRQTNPETLQGTSGERIMLFLEVPGQWLHEAVLMDFYLPGHAMLAVHRLPPDTPPPIFERC